MNAPEILRTLNRITLPPSQKGLVELGMVINLEKKDHLIRFDLKVEKGLNKERQSELKKACIKRLRENFGEDLKIIIGIKAIEPKTPPPPKKVKPERVKKIILVASGKGGVGKSTVAVNTAFALQNAGYKVGIIDADIYGPSIPLMLSLEGFRPLEKKMENKTYITAAEAYRMQVMSIGFFVAPNQPVPWRGPMVSKALNQIFMDTYWEDRDYIVVDMPPGTGDIHLSVASKFDIDGAIIVTTPQEISLSDVRKSIGMFQMKQIDIPILGVVENMSYFEVPELDNKKYYIFGKGGADTLKKEYGFDILAKIPITPRISEVCDQGVINVLALESEPYKHIANHILKK